MSVATEPLKGVPVHWIILDDENRWLELAKDPASAALFLSQKNKIKNLRLADTLDAIATKGRSGFYEGKVAAAKFFVNFILPGVQSKTTLITNADRSALDVPNRGLSSAG